MDPTFPLVPTANFLACILVLISLSRGMFQSWNVGVCSFAFWVSIMSFIMAVNTIVWADNVENKVPVWCDISSHLDIGSDAAIPASSFVIIRRLSIMINRRNHVSLKMKKLGLLVDLFFCVGCPMTQMILYYVVQENRFQIFEEIGCLESEIFAGSTILVKNFLPVLFPLASLTVYSPRLILAYFRHRRDLDDALSTNTTLNRHGFIKLLALGLLDIVVTFPLVVLQVIENTLQGGIPDFWPGWRVAHADFSSVPTASAEEWKSAGFWAIFFVKFDEWINPFFAVVFFALFGLTEQKRAQYKNAFWTVMKFFGFNPAVDSVASDIVFGSGPVIDSVADGTQATTTTDQSSAHSDKMPDRRNSLNNVAEIGKALLDSSGAKTIVVLGSRDSLA